MHLAQTRMDMFSSQGSDNFCSKYGQNNSLIIHLWLPPPLYILEICSHIQSIRKMAISLGPKEINVFGKYMTVCGNRKYYIL